MKMNQVITREGFDSLLAWLDSDRDLAAQKYETIRTRLIRIFICRGCCDAEDLADLTINRVTAKLPDIKESYVGDPVNYFHGVSRKVYLESLRKKEVHVENLRPIAVGETSAVDDEYECLSLCLNLLTPHQRGLVLEYYRSENQSNIEQRKELAQKMSLTAVALRIKAHRIRSTLKKCVLRCVRNRS